MAWGAAGAVSAASAEPVPALVAVAEPVRAASAAAASVCLA
jgi:hypothetical protein